MYNTQLCIFRYNLMKLMIIDINRRILINVKKSGSSNQSVSFVLSAAKDRTYYWYNFKSRVWGYGYLFGDRYMCSGWVHISWGVMLMGMGVLFRISQPLILLVFQAFIFMKPLSCNGYKGGRRGGSGGEVSLTPLWDHFSNFLPPKSNSSLELILRFPPPILPAHT